MIRKIVLLIIFPLVTAMLYGCTSKGLNGGYFGEDSSCAEVGKLNNYLVNQPGDIQRFMRDMRSCEELLKKSFSLDNE